MYFGFKLGLTKFALDDDPDLFMLHTVSQHSHNMAIIKWRSNECIAIHQHYRPNMYSCIQICIHG